MSTRQHQHLDIFLKEEDRILQETYRKFVDREIMPVRQLIDDDEDHRLINKIFQGLTDLGFQKMCFPEEYGGDNHLSGVTYSILAEEMSRGDLGICVAAFCTNWAFFPAIVAKNKVVLDKFASEFCGKDLRLACYNMTEPGSSHGGGGCDIENYHRFHGEKIRTRAELDGDEWVINGQKTMATNSGVANVNCVACTIDPNLGEEGIVLIYVPSPHEGVSYGKFETKAGLQADRNCATFFDNVRVPREYAAAGPGKDGELFKLQLAVKFLNGAMAVGVAQGAFETILKYTGERIVGGKPVREHSIAAKIIADMAIGIETARTYYLAAAYMFDHPEIYGPPTSDTMTSKANIASVYASEMAVKVINKAMQLMGSYAYIRDYDIEKYWRDSKMLELWIGGMQLSRFNVCRGYYEINL